MAIAPKFEANISADISKFMRNMATVDKALKKIASGVIVDIGADISNFMQRAATVRTSIEEINDNSTINIDADTIDLQRAIAEAQANLAELNNNSTVNINGNNSNFNNAANSVNKQANNLSRRITEARIGADIGSFESRMVEVTRALEQAGDTVTPQIELEMTRFTRDITEVQDRMREIARSTADPQVEADIAGFMAQMAAVQAQLDVVTREHDVDIRVDDGRARTRLAALWLQIRALTARDFVIRMSANWQNYQAVMGAIAAFSRNFAEITGQIGGGIKILLSPAIVPVLSSVVGLLGNLGPMLGAIAGSSFALVGAFAAAGFGAAGFAAVAAPSIGGVIKRAEELKKLEEKIAKADTWEERNKLMKEQSAIMDGMSGAQKRADKALAAFKDNYKELVTAMESQVLKVFEGGLKAITGVLTLARPMIRNATEAMGFLMDAFNRNLEAKDVKDFFTFLAKSAGPALITVGKAVGNFMMGLFNMFTAFLPLSVDTQNGFLAMSESFRKWSAGLGESKKFQAFIDYTKENMPKIRSIFSDAIQGMINMFGGFSGSSSDMMTSLQNLMERFKNWSATISENKGFQNFLDYFKTNGPVVVDAIAEIVKFIVNLGIAAAPIGEKMLGMITAFTNWTNGMMKAHPWLGRLAVGLIVIGGGLMTLVPIILLINALTNGLIVTIIKKVATIIWASITTVARWTLMGAAATLNAIKIAAAWTLATGVALVVAIAKMIAAAVIFVARWLFMGVQALLHAAKVAAAWALATGVAMVVAIAKMVATAAIFVAKWLWMGAQALFHAAKVAAAWALSTGTALVIASAKMAATAAVFVAKWVWMGVQSLLAAARMAAAWFIALGPIGWVAGAIIAIVALVILNWDKVSAWTAKAWSATAKFVTDAVSKIAGWVQQKFPALYTVIASYMTMAKTIISTMWNYIKSTFSNVLSFLKALVKGDFSGMKTAIQNQMELVKSTIQRIWNAIKSYLSTLLGTLLSKFGEMFGKIVSKVREKASEAVRVLGEKVGEMPGKVLSFVSRMVSAGGDLIQGLIDGAVGMAGDAISAITDIAGNMVEAATKFFKIKSPSRVFMEIGDYVGQGLAKGVLGTSKQVSAAGVTLASKLTKAMSSKTISNTQRVALAQTKAYAANQINVLKNLAKERELIAGRLKKASEKLTDALKVRNDYAKSVKDNALSFGSISNTDAKTGVDIVKQMKDRLAAIAKFQSDIKKLTKAGLNRTTLQDIVNAGVDGGGEKAAALTASSSAVIKEINKTQIGINAAASKLGSSTADQFYGLGVDAARGMVRGLEGQARALEMSANRISDTLVKAVKKRLGIHSPSRVFAELGGFMSQGLAVGVGDKARQAVDSVSTIASAMSGAFRPQLAMADMRASAQLDTSINRADMGVVRKSFAAEIAPVEVKQGDTILQVNGREFARWTAEDMKREMDRNQGQRNVSKRGTN